MRFLLTGASGFVGRQVATALVERGVTVRATDRGNRPLPGGVDDVVPTMDLFAEPRSFWDRALDGVDGVIHAAWYVEHGAYVTSLRNLDAVAGSLILARAAIEARIPRFVGLGTCFEYDLNAPMPLAPDSVLTPMTPYGAAKAGLYLALSRAFAQADLSFAWARLFYLHGEGEDPRRFVPHIRARLAAGEDAALSSGTQIRDYLEVGEAGRQIAELALGQTRDAVNICSGQKQTLADLAHSIAAPTGTRHLLRFGALPDRPNEPPEIRGIPFMTRTGTTP